MDLTSWWAAWHHHRQRIVYGLIGLLLFLAGWQVGRATSPYYANHPIIFSDTANPVSVDSGGSVAALQALREAGQQKQAGVSSTPEPAVAAAVTAGPSPSLEVTTSPSTTDKLFVASVNSDLYHHKDCPLVKQIKESNRVWFNSAAEAEAAGYVPSKCTQERA